MTPPKPPKPAPDPRLGGKTSLYSRDEVVSQLESFFEFLPHIPTGVVHKAPAGGWPSITADTLGGHLSGKSPEVIELLRRLPYIDGVSCSLGHWCDTNPWIASEAYPCDYRLLPRGTSGELTDRDLPGWVFNVRNDCGFTTRPDYGEGEEEDTAVTEERWPPWVVQLTTGTDREGSCWMLDTSDGTVTRYCVMKYVYPPAYPKDDPRAWRDRMCDDETKTLKDWLDELREEYRDMMYLGLPNVDSGGGYPSLYFRSPGDGPGSYQWEETEMMQSNVLIETQELRKIYKEAGWPDHYDKDACLGALKEWWRQN